MSNVCSFTPIWSVDPLQAKFFGGFLTVEALTKKMNKLLGIPEDVVLLEILSFGQK
jgi:hypothetical protein